MPTSTFFLFSSYRSWASLSDSRATVSAARVASRSQYASSTSLIVRIACSRSSSREMSTLLRASSTSTVVTSLPSPRNSGISYFSVTPSIILSRSVTVSSPRNSESSLVARVSSVRSSSIVYLPP